ncbi:ABC transporter permease [Telluribacter humicola]|uniref:ABC transporter permease n=1 Tax=Telluribacter humicola TaxID=1720261 RepID=UPI001A971815|nr:ABC transporter permease [Telluribacter humicola]
MNLLTSFRTELLKTRRTSLWYLCCTAAILVPFFMFFDYESGEGLNELKTDPWNIYFRQGQRAMNIMFLPMYIVLITTLLPQIEYKNNTWKQVLTSPQSTSHIFFSKLLVIQVLILLFILLHNLFMLVSLTTKSVLYPTLVLWEHTINWMEFLKMNAISYMSILATLGLQFWLGIRSKSFLLPIGVGIGLWILSAVMVAELHWPYAKYFPNVIPMMVVFPKLAPGLSTLTLISVGYAVLFLGLALLEFNTKKVKE